MPRGLGGDGLGECLRGASARAGQLAKKRRAAAEQVGSARVSVARPVEQLNYKRPVDSVGDGSRRVVRASELALRCAVAAQGPEPNFQARRRVVSVAHRLIASHERFPFGVAANALFDSSSRRVANNHI